ncbi:MAG: biotin--[acetyl-CoA-carboxylase] ligase [Nitrososphaerota archaeon]|nr:biotin--[acetyl-CoA-carboxylase] ligase [Nitrososphaerota archaeon]
MPKGANLSSNRERLAHALSHEKFKRLDIRPVYLTSVDSTQTYLSSELKSEREGDLAISETQTKGKGREGRSWVSQKGGLWMSIVLRPPSARVLERLVYLGANAIIDTLSEYGVKSSIKPPNDVYSNGKKIAGILADTVIQGDLSVVYLGVGVNVNNDPTKEDLISEIATSVSKIIGGALDLTEFTVSFLRHLDQLYADEIEAQISHN